MTSLNRYLPRGSISNAIFFLLLHLLQWEQSRLWTISVKLTEVIWGKYEWLAWISFWITQFSCCNYLDSRRDKIGQEKDGYLRLVDRFLNFLFLAPSPQFLDPLGYSLTLHEAALLGANRKLPLSCFNMKVYEVSWTWGQWETDRQRQWPEDTQVLWPS